MADPTPTPNDPAPTPDPTPTDPPPADPAKPSDKQPPWGAPENFDAEKAWELIQSLRGSDRPGRVSELEQQLADAQAAQQTQMDGIAKALGLKADDTPPDPAKLAEQITAEQQKTTAAASRADTAERHLAVFKAAMAPEVEANPLALLDSTSFLTSIAEVDHSDAEKVTEAIKAAVEKNPLFKSTPATPSFNGGPRTPAPTGAGTLGEAIANKMAAR